MAALSTNQRYYNKGISLVNYMKLPVSIGIKQVMSGKLYSFDGWGFFIISMNINFAVYSTHQYNFIIEKI